MDLKPIDFDLEFCPHLLLAHVRAKVVSHHLNAVRNVNPWENGEIVVTIRDVQVFDTVKILLIGFPFFAVAISFERESEELGSVSLLVIVIGLNIVSFNPFNVITIVSLVEDNLNFIQRLQFLFERINRQRVVL
jgi:hypothetical protein